MNFKQWLNEIAPGDYGNLVPGWRGGAKGPFSDPKRMPHDPLFWRNHDFKKQKSQADLEKATQDMEKDPSPESKSKYAQASADALLGLMPTVPESKPRGEYQGWTNWDTWLVGLWVSNERKHYEVLRGKSAAYLQKYVSQSKYRRELDNFASGEEVPVDLDMVNWEEVKDTL